MNNALPIDIDQNVTLRIGADPIARKGGIPYRSVLGALLSDTAPHPVIVDFISATHCEFGRSYSDAKIRLSFVRPVLITLVRLGRFLLLVPWDTCTAGSCRPMVWYTSYKHTTSMSGYSGLLNQFDSLIFMAGRKQ